jgi:hypothetical protein
MAQAGANIQTVGWSLESERELWRSICAPRRWHGTDGVSVATHPESYWYFVTKAWGAESYLRSHPAEPQWLYKPIHGKLCQWLQYHLLAWMAHALTGIPEQYNFAVVLPRGYGKTVSATKCGPLWTHLDDCDMTTLIQSATDDLSGDILKSQLAVMAGEDEDSWFSWLYGNWVQGAREKTKSYIKHGYRRAHNISEPSIDTSSAGIGATGYHPRQSWWDDPLEKNKLKQDRSAYLRGQHEAVNASANSLHRNGLRVLVLTRYLDDDVAGRHFREEGIASWSGMECPHMALFDKVPFGQGTWHVFFYQTEDELTGQPTHPRLWTMRAIADRKAVDPEDFACQQQNNPGSGEHAPLVESQIPWLYVAYSDFHWDVQIEWATIHIDTAFKNKENMGRGDDSCIVVWLKDARNNGILYLDTENLRASNEWREEDFNKELISVMLNLRRRGIFIYRITDETEPGGKAGTYKNRILGIMRTAGFQMGDEQFMQLNRTKDKKARIRTSAGHWASGYARILLNKNNCTCPPPDFDPIKNTYRQSQCPHFVVTPTVRKMVYQIVKVDTAQHDDLADAQADGFTSTLWRPPDTNPGIPGDSGVEVQRPHDEDLKSIGRAPTNEELLAIMADRDELRAAGHLDDGLRGYSEDVWTPPREPV